MQSKVSSVDEYMATLPDDRLPALTRVRELYRSLLPGYTECMDFGMPCYKRGDLLMVSFASQAKYIALYGLTQTVINRHRAELKGANLGKSCVRFARPETIDFKLLRTMLEEALATKSAGC